MAHDGWWVYLLACSDGTFYCGVTTDVAKRLAAHEAGRGARYTRGRRPVKVVWAEPAPTRSTALRREREVKRWPRARKEALVQRWNGAGL
jgi:putative endonuclease